MGWLIFGSALPTAVGRRQQTAPNAPLRERRASSAP